MPSATTSIDKYISEQAEEVQPILHKIREVIHAAAPEATEKISWRMPTFWQGENLIHFAAFKKHVSIFPGGEASAVFAGKLTEYKTAKGTIQFQLTKPIPYELIAEITRWRVSAVKNKTNLTKIPGIGKKMAEHLSNIGYPDIESLKGQDPEEIYTKHCLLYGPGNQSCKCVLYSYRLAVYYADHDGQLPPDRQNWGDWKTPL